MAAENSNDVPNQERPRGMLTEADRRYLRGEEQFDNANTENAKRHRIRERIRNAILDFSVAHGGLERDDIGMIYDDDNKDEIRDAMIDALAFLYLGSGPFGKMVEEGIERAVKEYTGFQMPDVSVSLHIEKDPIETDDLVRMIKNSETLPPKAKAQLVSFNPPLKEEHRRVLEGSDLASAEIMLSMDDEFREHGEDWNETWDPSDNMDYTHVSEDS